MDAYGLYELHVKAKAREQTNIFLTPWSCIPHKNLDSTANREQKKLFLRHRTMKS